MIHQIENSEAQQVARQPADARSVAPATAAGKSFASVLAEKKSAPAAGKAAERGSTSESGSADAARAPKHPKPPINAPEGEVWRPVRGNDDYARITEGPRAGQYVNLSRGERRGEIFKVEVRDGKRVHVYGEGANQTVVDATKDSGKVADGRGASAARTPRGEEWAPVNGVSNHADILNGPRNGYYVNTSGGVRDGMAFQIVKQGDRTFHVYGKGKNRQMIEVGGAARRDDDDKKSGGTRPADSNSDDTRAAGSRGTGGVRPPS